MRGLGVSGCWGGIVLLLEVMEELNEDMIWLVVGVADGGYFCVDGVRSTSFHESCDYQMRSSNSWSYEIWLVHTIDAYSLVRGIPSVLSRPVAELDRLKQW